MSADQDFIDFKCPYCNEAVSFPQDSARRVQECPNCAESLIVPRKPGDPGQKVPLPITTPRLTLRRLATADWKDLLEFFSDEDLFQYAEGGPVDEEQILRWLETDKHVNLTTPNTRFCLGVAIQPSGKVIGVIYLNFSGESHLQTTVRLYISREVQRQGFAAEAVNAVLGFCFEGLGLHRVSASCDSRNVAALKLAAKVGMRREGEFRKDQFVSGEWVETAWQSILAEEYFNSKSQPPRRGST